MANPLQIRHLQASDVSAYRAIRLAALYADPDAFGSAFEREAAWPDDMFAQRLASSTVLGAYLDGRIVGMAGLKPYDGPKDCHKAFIWGMYVMSEARGRGVATALLDALCQAAGEAIEQLVLRVVKDNAAAVALYRRAGFAVYGTEPRALKGPAGYADELLMVRFLRETNNQRRTR